MNWFKLIFTKNNIMSSKRVCGVFGFVICAAILIYCTINVLQAPAFIDIFFISCCSLLGIDSITDIWKPQESK